MHPVSSDVDSTFSASRQDAKTPRFTSESPFTMRSMPSFVRLPPKLRTKPSLSPLSFKYESSCFDPSSVMGLDFILWFMGRRQARKGTDDQESAWPTTHRMPTLFPCTR